MWGDSGRHRAFFLTRRPPLLPEDVEFIGTPLNGIVAAVPGLTRWLSRVFWVLGGYIATTGILVIYVANTALKAGDAAALVVVAAAGITSIGWMTLVNFLLHSHFRWALVALDGVWTVALLLAAGGHLW